jgi:hypothetical protein
MATSTPKLQLILSAQLLVTTMPDIAYPLIKGHLCTPNFCRNLKTVPGKPSIYEHKTMGCYKFLLSSLGESYPTTAALQGRALYRAGGYIAWNPLAFQQVEKVVHIVGSNGGMHPILPTLELANSVRIPIPYFPQSNHHQLMKIHCGAEV